MGQELMLPAAFTGAVSSVFAQQPTEELGAGIASSYAVMGYKGKTWTVKYQGNEYPLMRDPNGPDPGPRASIECVILKASNNLSKIFYAAGYAEGNIAPPDCFSNNGVTPDLSSPRKQAPACATCPQNAWGSKVTEQGKQVKACQDSKRLVIIPSDDLENDFFGGPMLLRIPPASLKDLKAYGDLMQSVGFPYFAVKTRISFDAKDAFPHLVLTAIQPLNDVEARRVVELREDPRTQRILDTPDATAPAADAAAPPPPANPFANLPQGQPVQMGGVQQAQPYQGQQQAQPQAPQPQPQQYQQPAPQPQPMPQGYQPQAQPQQPQQAPQGYQPQGFAPQPQAVPQGFAPQAQPQPQAFAPQQPAQPPQGFAPQGETAAPAPKKRQAPKRSNPPAGFAPQAQPQPLPQGFAPQAQPQGFAPQAQPQGFAPQAQPQPLPQGTQTVYPPQAQPQPQPQQFAGQPPQPQQFAGQPPQGYPYPQQAQPQPQQAQPQDAGAPVPGAPSFSAKLDALFPQPQQQ